MSELTGRIRYRDGRFGGLVLQVEYNWTGMPAYSRYVTTEPRWRDAVRSDLIYLQCKRPEPSRRQRIFGVGRKEPIVTHASNQPHHPRS